MEGTLVLSSNRACYAVGDPMHGPDLSTGRPIEIFLGGQWVPGHVDHGARYAANAPAYVDGYCFISDSGDICGLCCGMRVRTL